ncbi:MAG: hypothetical protein L0Z07_03310, partial [Planctomycetes bacterium]|nr:hypothetical protein [Planctomycetota bacterium]
MIVRKTSRFCHGGERRGRPSVRCFLVSAAVMLAFPLCLQPLVLQAQTSSIQQMPANIQPNGMVMKLPLKQKISRKSGLAIEVDTRWAENYGYRPIRVTVTAPNATTSDHSVTIRLHAGWWSRTQGQMTVEQDFDLPAGSMSANTQISLPQYRLALQFISWEVWVDGVRDNDLSLDEVTAMTTMGGSLPYMPIGLSMLVVGPTSRQRQSGAPTTQAFQVLSLPIGEFPVRWIDYTSFDIVAIDFSELRQLASSSPDALTALRRWVRTGGHVWVGNIGEDWKRLAEVGDDFVLRGPLPSDQ